MVDLNEEMEQGHNSSLCNTYDLLRANMCIKAVSAYIVVLRVKEPGRKKQIEAVLTSLLLTPAHRQMEQNTNGTLITPEDAALIRCTAEFVCLSHYRLQQQEPMGFSINYSA